MALSRAPPNHRSSRGSKRSTPRSRRSSMLVARVVSSPRVTCNVPRRCRVRRVTPERQHIPGHRQNGDGQHHHAGHQQHVEPQRRAPQRSQQLRDHTDLGRPDPGLSGDPPGQADQHRAGDHPGQGCRRKADPATSRVGRGPSPRRTRPTSSSVGASCGRRHPVQQLGPQLAGGRRGQPVERHRLRAMVRGTGSDLDLHQFQQPLQRVGADVDGADAVTRNGEMSALEDASSDFDHCVGDPVPGGGISADAQRDHGAGGDQTPGRPGVADPTREEQHDQHGDELDELPDRLDQQHARRQPSPRLVR